MGYGMSRLEDEYYEPEGQDTDGSSSDQVNDEFSKLHNDIFHTTRMRSGLSESIYKSVGANKGMISTAKLLSGREVDCSGKGMFSSGDRAFVLGRYVPVNGPELLDRMDSRAYVSQFSADGTLFVAGFQGSHIRIYDVDRGWRMLKDIHARSLRWTISDVSLSPDQRYLVYSSLAPIIHIVNVGSAARESYANVTPMLVRSSPTSLYFEKCTDMAGVERQNLNGRQEAQTRAAGPNQLHFVRSRAGERGTLVHVLQLLQSGLAHHPFEPSLTAAAPVCHA